MPKLIRRKKNMTMENDRNILCLPKELLEHILSFIHVEELSKSVSCTCMTFFEISQVIVSGRFRLDSNGIANFLCHRETSQSISYVIIQQFGCRLESTYEWLDAIDDLEDQEKVQGVGIICTSPSYDSLRQIIDCCSNLKYFYWFGNKDMKDVPSFMQDDSKTRSRRELLEDDKLLTSLPELLRRSANLEYIWCCNDLLNFGINSKCISSTPTVNSNSSRLKMLKIYNFDSNVAFSLSKQYPEIKAISISVCKSISDDQLKNMLVEQNCVEHLSLSSGKSYLRESIRYWIDKLSLETLRLDCSGVKDVNIDVISVQLKNLKRLELGKRITMSEGHFLSLMKNNPEIEELVLKDQKFSTAATISFISVCKHLKKLEFSEYQIVTDEVLKQISESCPNLVDLNVNSKWKITDTGFCDILDKCVLLEKLDISGTRLTEKSFFKMGDTAKNLKHLKMRRCDYVNDESLSAVFRCCQNLSTLDIGWCNQLTKKALNAIAKYSKHLVYLSMPGLYEAVFSVETIKNLLTKCTKLKYLNFLDYRDALHTRMFSEMLDELFHDIKKTRSSFHVVIEEERGGHTFYNAPFSSAFP